MSDDANARVYADNGKGDIPVPTEPELVVVPDGGHETVPEVVAPEPAVETAPETPAPQQPETDVLTAEPVAEPHIP